MFVSVKGLVYNFDFMTASKKVSFFPISPFYVYVFIRQPVLEFFSSYFLLYRKFYVHKMVHTKALKKNLKLTLPNR